MIDLHCHILPGLDDGALDIEDSVAMAQQAYWDGIGTVCATPHIRHDHRVAIEEIAARVEALERVLAERGVEVGIVPGGELAETEADGLSDEQLHLVALGGAGGWLLVEPAPGPLGAGLEELVERLAARGLHAIVAHPERHAGADFEERLLALRDRGCLIQWTAEFVARASAGDLVPRLAQEGLVHLLGSDAHSSRAGRPVQLAEGYERLALACTPRRLQWIVELAPRAILRGESVTAMP
ncbi:MAG: tyrosine-protein phosphatase [Solirubrobacterales bacterium]